MTGEIATQAQLSILSLSSALYNTHHIRLFITFVILVKQSTLLANYCSKDDEVRDFVCSVKVVRGFIMQYKPNIMSGL